MKPPLHTPRARQALAYGLAALLSVGPAFAQTADSDALRKLHPEERIYTFWDYFRNAWPRDAGLRIDHFLLNPPMAKRLVAGGVDRHVRGWEKTSDHAPVWIELKPATKLRKVTE